MVQPWQQEELCKENPGRSPSATLTEESDTVLLKTKIKEATADGFVFKPMEMQQILEVAKRWQQQEREASWLTQLYTRCPPRIRLNNFPPSLL